MLKLFTLCIENIKKQTDYYMVKKKQQNKTTLSYGARLLGHPVYSLSALEV